VRVCADSARVGIDNEARVHHPAGASAKVFPEVRRMAETRKPELKDAAWPDVLRTMIDELKIFVQQEIRLASSELGDKVKQAGTGAGMFGAAGFMGFLAAGALTAAFILGLAVFITPWLAALLVALVYGAIAGVLALSGKKKVQDATPLVPRQAIDSLESTKVEVQHAWQQGSEQGQRTPSSSSHMRRGGTSVGGTRY
jgi:hypothetical protein